jgi:hypothetical protein
VTPSSPFTAFSAALRARHHRHSGAVPTLRATVLLVPRPRDTAWHVHTAATHVNIAPRITLTMAAMSMTQHVTPPPSTAATAPVVLARLRHSTSTVRVREAMTLVQHTHARGVRVEPGGAPAALTPAPIPNAGTRSLRAPEAVIAAPPPTSLIVARPTPCATAPTAVTESTSARFEPRNGTAPSAPPSAPTIDFEQITDSVLGAIDRRLIAHRERYGGM